MSKMEQYQCWSYPKQPPDDFVQNKQNLVVVGVIGKSAFADANKLAAFKILNCHQLLHDHDPQEGAIQFYYKPNDSLLLVHFETTFDAVCMQKFFEQDSQNNEYWQFLLFNQKVKNRFARMLLFATQICHIVVFVELNVAFDASLLALFKSLKIIRDKHILKFLPKLIKNTNAGSMLGKQARLCSPRFLFLFENHPDGYDKSNEALSRLEFEVEDNIYMMLRNEFIVNNNSAMSLFSIPSNKRFVYFNTDSHIREDPVLKSAHILTSLLTKSKDEDVDDLDDLCPFKGFGKPLIQCTRDPKTPSAEESFLNERTFMTLLREHVNEALTSGFDDSLTKYKSNKNHFVLLPANSWYEIFIFMHKIFVENPDNPKFEASDVDYKAYLDNFDKIVDIDKEFFAASCDIGLQKAFAIYNNPALTHYNKVVHKKLLDDAIRLYMKYARGPQTAINEAKLREMCENCWQNGKQQCEFPSLRGHPCVLPKHVVKDEAEHSSGCVFVSACNCGKTQGRREDPYTIRQANYEFYEYMANNCNLCAKVKKIVFAVFEPSINDYRAAEFEIAFPRLSINDPAEAGGSKRPLSPKLVSYMDDISQPLTASQGGSHTNLSLASSDNINRIDGRRAEHSSDDDDSVNELVIQVKDKDTKAEDNDKERHMHRQPSTTEYLPGMCHTESPAGLLPQFPSWSLCCVGSSSIYSHNTGLMEHFQSGFLPGSNFLLPWDVHVRLERSSSWAAAYEKSRYRKMGEVFILKIFVGYEYECPRGHRFMMASPDKVLRGGGAGIMRDSGSKVVYNNMPLYFPCACRSNKTADVAQLMRIHVVTPKAPVNVILDPKVRTGNRDYVFTLGLPEPPKLTQSAYWILRLPYIYQGDDGPIHTPSDVNTSNASTYGCLLAGMFGVSETTED